jgi:putative effector of murein hydrolase LrgA (UPF0299 family)
LENTEPLESNMSHRHGHSIGFAVIIGLITFAFGVKVARTVVGATLIFGALAFVAIVCFAP